MQSRAIAVKLCVKKKLSFIAHAPLFFQSSSKLEVHDGNHEYYLLCGFRMSKWQRNNTKNQSSVGQKWSECFLRLKNVWNFGGYSCQLMSTIKCYMTHLIRCFLAIVNIKLDKENFKWILDVCWSVFQEIYVVGKLVPWSPWGYRFTGHDTCASHVPTTDAMKNKSNIWHCQGSTYK